MNLLNPAFRYTNAASTDVSRHWRTLKLDNERRRMQKQASKQSDNVIRRLSWNGTK